MIIGIEGELGDKNAKASCTQGSQWAPELSIKEVAKG